MLHKYVVSLSRRRRISRCVARLHVCEHLALRHRVRMCGLAVVYNYDLLHTETRILAQTRARTHTNSRKKISERTNEIQNAREMKR